MHCPLLVKKTPGILPGAKTKIHISQLPHKLFPQLLQEQPPEDKESWALSEWVYQIQQGSIEAIDLLFADKDTQLSHYDTQLDVLRSNPLRLIDPAVIATRAEAMLAVGKEQEANADQISPLSILLTAALQLPKDAKLSDHVEDLLALTKSPSIYVQTKMHFGNILEVLFVVYGSRHSINITVGELCRRLQANQVTELPVFPEGPIKWEALAESFLTLYVYEQILQTGTLELPEHHGAFSFYERIAAANMELVTVINLISTKYNSVKERLPRFIEDSPYDLDWVKTQLIEMYLNRHTNTVVVPMGGLRVGVANIYITK